MDWGPLPAAEPPVASCLDGALTLRGQELAYARPSVDGSSVRIIALVQVGDMVVDERRAFNRQLAFVPAFLQALTVVLAVVSGSMTILLFGSAYSAFTLLLAFGKVRRLRFRVGPEEIAVEMRGSRWSEVRAFIKAVEAARSGPSRGDDDAVAAPTARPYGA